MADDTCPETVSMDQLGSSREAFNVKTAVKSPASSFYVSFIVASSVGIIVLHFAHVIGLLYADYVLMINSGLAYIPAIYLEAIPSYLMVLLVFVMFSLYCKWKSWLAGEESVDITPGVIIMTFVANVSINILAYTVQVLVVVIEVYRRHIARLPSGDRCSCYIDDLSYLIGNKSTGNYYKCICYVPDFPDYARRVQLFTDTLASLTPDNLEKYTGITSQRSFDKVDVTKYQSEEEYQTAFAKERFSGAYTTIIILLMCNLVILAVRLALWIRLKELWIESEKRYYAKQITDSNDCLRTKPISVKKCFLSACQVAKQLETLEQKYREKKRSAMKVVIEEFTFAFLEGTDAIGLYLEILQYAYVYPDSILLVPAITFICIDICLFNWDNTLLIIPLYGERIASYIRASSAVFINLPFFAIRLILLLDEGKTGFPVLLLVLFLMKELTAFILSLVDLIQMIIEDCKKKKQ